MTPEQFDGKITMNPEGNPFDVWFYRRESDRFSLDEFIDSIKPEDMGWDKPTGQLFYKDSEGKTYSLKFEELK